MTLEFAESVTMAQALAQIELETGVPLAHQCLIVAGVLHRIYRWQGLGLSPKTGHWLGHQCLVGAGEVPRHGDDRA